MALSDDATTLAYIRSQLPTVENDAPEYVSDNQLDYIYANKADSDVGKTIAWALRQMCIKLSNQVAKTNTRTGDGTQNQHYRIAVCEQADRAANLAGINTGQLGTVTTGTINLGIDEEDEYFNIT